MGSSLQTFGGPRGAKNLGSSFDLDVVHEVLEAHARHTNASRASDVPLHPEILRGQLLDVEEARIGRADYYCMLSKAYMVYTKRSVVHVGRCWC